MIPKISVYVLCHNYAKYLNNCLKSISAQIFTEWELIIIDDGSSDNSWDLIKEFEAISGDNVTTLRNKIPIGLKAAANQALRMCNGDFVIRVDADDKLTDNCLLSLYTKITTHPTAKVCYGGYFYIDDHDEIIGTEILRKSIVSRFAPHGACTLISRRSLLANGGYDESFSTQDGWDMFYRINKGVQPAIVEAPLFYYRKHSTSLSSNFNRQIESRRKLFENLTSTKLKTVIPSIDFKVSISNLNTQQELIISLLSKLSDFVKSYKNIPSKLSMYSSSDEMRDLLALVEKNYPYPHALLEKPSLHSTKDHLTLLNSILKNDARKENDIWAYLNLNQQDYSYELLKEHYDTLVSSECDQLVSIREERMPTFKLGAKGLIKVANGKYNDLFHSDQVIYSHTGEVLIGWNDTKGTKIFADKLGYVER